MRIINGERKKKKYGVRQSDASTRTNIVPSGMRREKKGRRENLQYGQLVFGCVEWKVRIIRPNIYRSRIDAKRNDFLGSDDQTLRRTISTQHRLSCKFTQIEKKKKERRKQTIKIFVYLIYLEYNFLKKKNNPFQLLFNSQKTCVTFDVLQPSYIL